MKKQLLKRSKRSKGKKSNASQNTREKLVASQNFSWQNLFISLSMAIIWLGLLIFRVKMVASQDASRQNLLVSPSMAITLTKVA